MGHEPLRQGVIRAGTEWFREDAPRKIPTAEIVAAVEESISQLNGDRRHLVRAELSSILRRAKPTPKNIPKLFRRTGQDRIICWQG